MNIIHLLQEEIGRPVRIISGKRTQAENKRVGGSRNSGHLTGESADISFEGMSNAEVGDAIRALHSHGLLPDLTFVELIAGRTNTSVHIGVDRPGKRRTIWGRGFNV